jgi:hypothetical protein
MWGCEAGSSPFNKAGARPLFIIDERAFHDMVPRVFLCAAYFLAMAQGEVFNLDDSAPLLVSNGREVRWPGGWDALVVADSCCTRVNVRGVYAKPSHWTPRADLPSAGWASSPCVPDGGGALCVAPFGAVFPSAERPRYNASAAWGGAGCTRGRDGRVLDPAHGYDVSACDVLDGGGDVAVCGRDVCFRRTGVSTWAYWLLCLLAVFVVRSLSYLVVHRAGGGQGRGCSDWVTVAACVAALPLALAPDGDAGFVTVEERFFFIVMCCYAGGYALLFAYRFAFSQGCGEDPPIYNLIAATLQVIASRLYLGAETPYNPVILWAVATRALLKLRGERGGGFAVRLTTFADSLVLSLMCVLGFGYNALYLAAVFALAVATSDALLGARGGW